jgi:hypothetical protein
MQLSGPELKKLREALLTAFVEIDDFDQMMKDRLNRKVSDYTAPKKTPLMIAAVLEGENAEETLPELVKAARAERPNNSALRDVAEELGLAAGGLADRELQKIVEATQPFVDFHAWLKLATSIEHRVCRIVLDEGTKADPLGTGFLVGPSAVMTNYHVVEDIISGAIPPSRLRAQFDHYVLRDGSTDPGTFVGFAEKWLIDAEPPSPLDDVDHPLQEEVGVGELDYALLRLARNVANEPFGPALNPAAVLEQRGWIDLTPAVPQVPAGEILFIVQHPSGDPMKIAWHPRSVIGYSPAGRRLRYRTNTLPGSSGSPVFDIMWRLVALHHSGDPKETKPATYNEGIPLPAIVQRLEARGTMKKLKD